MTTSPDRHHRQRILPEIGDAGQQRLRAGHAVIVGVGALGTHLADTLGRAGVGRITLIDRDAVEWTNLQRQVLFTEADAREGAPKAVAAARALARIDSAIRIDPIVDDLTADSARRLLPELLVASHGRSQCDVATLQRGSRLRREPRHRPAVLLDGTDNFHTRFLLNDIAVATGAPMVYAGVVGVTGLMTPILPSPLSPRERAGVRNSDRATPCLRCLFGDAPPPGRAPTCDTAGVLGPAVSIIAGFQAAEAIKILTGAFEAVTRALVEVDAWTGAVRRIDTTHARRPDCPCCANRRFDFLDAPPGDGTAALCGADAVQVTPATTGPVDLRALADRLAPVARARATEHLLRATLPDAGVEITVFPTGRAIVRGVTDPARARALYARYIGA